MSRNVRSSSMRKRGADGHPLTPSEQHKKDGLMRAFCQLDGPKGASAEFRANYDQINWGGTNPPANGETSATLPASPGEWDKT